MAELGGKGSQLDLRAGYTLNHVWVTPTAREERWPAGDYVNQSEPGEGLPRWTEADRPSPTVRSRSGISSAIITSCGPRIFRSCGFMQPPHVFFDRNPTLDVPPTEKRQSCCV